MSAALGVCRRPAAVPHTVIRLLALRCINVKHRESYMCLSWVISQSVDLIQLQKYKRYKIPRRNLMSCYPGWWPLIMLWWLLIERLLLILFNIFNKEKLFFIENKTPVLSFLVTTVLIRATQFIEWRFLFLLFVCLFFFLPRSSLSSSALLVKMGQVSLGSFLRLTAQLYALTYLSKSVNVSHLDLADERILLLLFFCCFLMVAQPAAQMTTRPSSSGLMVKQSRQ